MFIQRNENQSIGYFGADKSKPNIELGDQVCLSLENNQDIEIVAEVLTINGLNYQIKIIEFESEDNSSNLPLKLNQSLEIEEKFIQYCYKKEN
ncbi:MAG: hypothetical protein COB02_06120 [Candidatus Cloacimonadota bacterium]|nr:MAG: hypothetical protein COB02_06120 [Candidatus Cloacimonadota bacterium]